VTFWPSKKAKSNRLHRTLRAAVPVLAVLGMLLAGSPARAQLNSNIAGVNLAADLTTSLTITASPGLVNFALIPNGTATGSVPVTVNVSWTLRPSVGAVTTYAYFTSAAVALTDGVADNIPSSSVAGSVNGGAYGAFIGVGPFAATSSITLSSIKILGNNRTGNHTDTLNLQISTIGLNLPAGTYTGVLNIQAQAL
jgi:hypothetical protein